jgi:hypothetical protein
MTSTNATHSRRVSLTSDTGAPDDSQYSVPGWLVVFVGYKPDTSRERYCSRVCCERMGTASDIGAERERKRCSGSSLRPARETPGERDGGRGSRAQAKGQHESAATAGAAPDLCGQDVRWPARLSSGDHRDQSHIRPDANGGCSFIECPSP